MIVNSDATDTNIAADAIVVDWALITLPDISVDIVVFGADAVVEADDADNVC